MTDEEVEEWIAKRVSAIRSKLREFAAEYPEHFWEEIDSIVLYIVEGCAEIDDFDWPENLHLGDVLDKHIIRHMVDLQRQLEKETRKS